MITKRSLECFFKDRVGCKCKSLYIRWAFLLLVTPTFYVTSSYFFSKDTFLKIFFSAIFYNTIFTIASLKNKNGKESLLFVFADIIFITLFTTISGGASSELYVLYVFVLSYYTICKRLKNVVNMSILCLVLYDCSVIMSGITVYKDLNIMGLLGKNMIIALSIPVILFISKEVRKFNELHKKEFKLARTDKLTGLSNRHHMEQRLQEESLYVKSTSNPVNILMFDLDNFKSFNDTYGHVWGDKLLHLFSEIILQNVRKSDVAFRYGGEEFLVLVRDLDLFIAKSVGERIRKQLEQQSVFIGNDENKKVVTVSCGIAQFTTCSKDIKEVIDMADKALYFAKENGKNRVECYDEIDLEYAANE